MEAQKTKDGRALVLSKRGTDRASGAICALTAAWERPDEFSRAFSAIGTCAGLRGGDAYPTPVREFEPKQLRVYLQDGSKDPNIYGGDWWMVNRSVERSFARIRLTRAGGHTPSTVTVVSASVPARR